MKFYSAIKKNETLTHGTTWMDLENVIITEKKPVIKDYILCTSISMKCPELANLKRQKVD